jgi:D-cysteine desulfhydrase
MALLHDTFPGLDLAHRPLGKEPTPVRPLPPAVAGCDDVWVKDDSVFGDGAWGGNKVRKLEWILPEAQRKGARTIFTVGGIGTHWGLCAALYGREAGLRTVLGLIDQPVDDHVLEQQARLRESGAELHLHHTPTRLRAVAPYLLARITLQDRRPPMFLGPGGSNPFGTLGYVEAALEIAEQVRAGELPEPATVVVPAGSGGTTAGLALGLRLAGLSSRVLGIVVNDTVRLDAPAIAKLANKTAVLLEEHGADLDGLRLSPDDVTMREDWLGATYGAHTPAGMEALAAAAADGLTLEPVYTAKAVAAIRAVGGSADMPGPVLWVHTHGPRS